MLSDPIVEKISDGRFVLRDDLIPGGTKRCYCDDLFREGIEYVYATPAYGGAQIAIAHASKLKGSRATIFVAKRKELHARTKEANRAGAKIIQVPFGYLNNVQAKAKAYCLKYGAVLLPFGMNTPDAIDRIAARAARAEEIYGAFDEIWCASGSGVLARGIGKGSRAKIQAVQVGRDLGPGDAGQATIHVCPIPFDRDAKEKPPFPSCSNYDAKVWQFFRMKASGRSLYWNVLA
jgi:hypothetical protein